MSNTLITRYRPGTFAEVIGQSAAAFALEDAITRGTAQQFLLTGPSGCGKTTMARIAAIAFGCASRDIREVDAATNTGIDDMREVTQALRYRPIKAGKVALVIDEVHRLSKNAWDSLLKSIEEPPEWAVWFFCTTEADKVPTTVVTRCVRLDLKPVPWQDLLEQLLQPIAAEEGMDVTHPEIQSILGLCAREANGAPRQALTNLAACLGTTSLADAQSLLRLSDAEEGAAVDLARALQKGGGAIAWPELMKIVALLEGESPEGVRRVIQGYFTKVARSAKGPPGKALAILENFCTPFASDSATGQTQLILALARTVIV